MDDYKIIVEQKHQTVMAQLRNFAEYPEQHFRFLAI